MGGVRSVVFETVQILVSLTTVFTPIGLLLLHADGTRVRCGCFRVED